MGRAFVAVIGSTILLAGCVASAGALLTEAPSQARSPAEAPASPSPVKETPTIAPIDASALTADVPAEPPASCPVTLPPRKKYVPPPGPYPRTPPAYYRMAWFGTDRLWTTIRAGGELWHSLPHDTSGYSQKTFWWSADWDVNKELEPKIGVVGRRLDVPGPVFSAGNPGTNGQADIGSFMLVGVEVPTAGCWEITARFRETSLSYVVWIDDD